MNVQQPPAPTGSNMFERFVINHSVSVVLIWFILVLIAIPMASQVKNRLVVAGTLKSGQATFVNELLSTRFSNNTQNILLLVATGFDSTDWRASDQVAALKSSIESFDFVMNTSWQTPQRRNSISGGHPQGAFLITHLDPETDPMGVLGQLRAAAQSNLAKIRQVHATAELQWTGDPAIREAIITSSNRDLRRSELLALPLVFLLLLVAFRSLVAALIPLLFGALAIVFTLASAALIAEFITLSIMVQTVASLLGLALGIDYALLMINRFRESSREQADRRLAALLTLRKGGKTILISGSAVAIGFAALFLVPVDQLRSIACAGLLVALFSVMLAVTLMPALLVLLGSRIEFGTIPPLKLGLMSRSGWERWARLVCRRPVLVLVLSGAPLLALALSSHQMSSTFPEETWLPPQTEAVKAMRKLEVMDEGNIVKTLNIIYRLPEGASAIDGQGTRALRMLHRHLINDERSQRV